MSNHSLVHRIQAAIDTLRCELDQEKGSQDHWTGALSTSALSTATAVSALALCRREFSKQPWETESGNASSMDSHEVWGDLIERGSQWLSNAQNIDGGFGDTDRSLSNIATTLLVVAAWELAGHTQRYEKQVFAARTYVDQKGGWDGLRRRYGKDKTFVVPIMTNCALAGLVDWKEIPTLPFEAAALPQSWYRFAQMPVVSYAVPALVAIGQAQYHHRTPGNLIVRWIRSMSLEPTRQVLTRMQPTSGGYLEAVPLTSFVLMSMASIGQAGSRVAIEARKFILNSVLKDGSWPIDTNLATWVTSLASVPYFNDPWNQEPRREVLWNRTIDWLLSCQHRKRHPFTGAHPGGWGWTNLSGAVPDSDDTPAALIALKQWHDQTQHHRNRSMSVQKSQSTTLTRMREERVFSAAAMGVEWLLRLQNRDGGWPTFCRGWGTLPFDRSGSDLTAHAIRALSQWREPLMSSQKRGGPSVQQFDKAIRRGFRYLAKQQRDDGSWLPLWFGNQDRPEEDNPIYGTGRVLLGFTESDHRSRTALKRGARYLMSVQNPDGSWGGGVNSRYPGAMPSQGTVCGTMEETAIALEGIMMEKDTTDTADSILRGLDWLCHAVQSEHYRTSQPIGFYFARLWYYEKMYPLVFSLSALQQGLQFCQR